MIPIIHLRKNIDDFQQNIILTQTQVIRILLKLKCKKLMDLKIF